MHRGGKGCVSQGGLLKSNLSCQGQRSEASRDGSTGKAAGERPPRRKQHLGAESGSPPSPENTRLELEKGEGEGREFFARRMRNFPAWAAFVYN